MQEKISKPNSEVFQNENKKTVTGYTTSGLAFPGSH